MYICVPSWSFTFAPPKIRKTENPKFCPAADLLEIGTERRGLCRHGGGEARSETGREVGNLEARDGEPGWSAFSEGVAWGAGGVGEAGFQDSSFSESGH